MLMSKERRSAVRTLRGWAISVLHDAGAIRECEEHGWMQDRGDPHARERAFDVARLESPAGASSEVAADAIAEVLDSIGDTCPECPTEDDVVCDESTTNLVVQDIGPCRRTIP